MLVLLLVTEVALEVEGSLRSEQVVRDPQAGETPAHGLLVAGGERCVGDVLRDHMLTEPDPHPASVLS